VRGSGPAEGDLTPVNIAGQGWPSGLDPGRWQPGLVIHSYASRRLRSGGLLSVQARGLKMPVGFSLGGQITMLIGILSWVFSLGFVAIYGFGATMWMWILVDPSTSTIARLVLIVVPCLCLAYVGAKSGV
jgi:hypothetical protein